MNLFGTTTKTIKTYGKKGGERVVTINAWNHEADEKKGAVSLSDRKKISLKESTISKLQTNKDVNSKNSKPVKLYTGTKQRKTFTKGFTKSKYYLSPIKPSKTVVNHASEFSHVQDSENVSPKQRENTPPSIDKIRLPLTPKQLNKKHYSQTEDHDELICKVIITPLKDLNIIQSKENANVNNDIEIDSKSWNIKKLEDNYLMDRKKESSFSDVINKSAKEHKITDELKELLNTCDQKQLRTFEEFLGTDCLNNTTKIGEASFSEVFAAYAPNFTSTKVKCVFKIIPFGRGKEVLVNGEEQCSVRDITQEIKTTLELGGRTGLDPKLRVGFLRLYGVGVCRGKYPKVLLKEWDRWDKEYKSESDRPDYFDDKQLYAVLIVEYGGLDLEHVKLKNWAQAWSVLTQVGWSTAQAEQSLKFEHRDLHWGNITVKPTKIKSISYNLLLANMNVEVETFGVRACIIDYTLSRMERGDDIIHVNIVDEGYFTGEGDYQFDIYRMMRKESKGDWKSFWPKTNVFWLHYIADKLLTAKKLSKPKKDNEQYDYYNAILGFKKRALAKNGGYKSAMEAMNQDEAWRL